MSLPIDSSLITRNIYFQRYKNLLIPVILIITSCLILGLVVFPTGYSYYKSLIDQQKTTADRIFYEKKLNELKALDVTEYQQDLDNTIRVLPEDKDIPESLNLIINSLATSRLSLNDVFIGAGSGDSGNNSFTLRLDVTGGIPQLKEFIDTVQNEPRLMKVNGIEFSSLGDGVNGILTLDIYYKPLPKTIPAELTALPKLTSKDKELLEKLKLYFQNNPTANIQSSTSSGKINPFE